MLLKKHVAIQEPIREPLLFTTVAHSSINAPSRKRDVHRFRVAFFGVAAAGWVLFWRSITCPAPREKYKQYLNETIHA
jgi:hypothetical protein